MALTEKLYLYYFYLFIFVFREGTLEVLRTSAVNFMAVVHCFKHFTGLHSYMDLNDFKNKNSYRLSITYVD